MHRRAIVRASGGAGSVDRSRSAAHFADMPDDETTAADSGPTAEELAGTIFANVGDFSQSNGGAVLTSEAAIGGGDG
jgi:hypothetical protein